MDGDDPDTMMAYYMMVNHGWRPQQVEDLPFREKVLLAEMTLREIRSRRRG